jgi:hypothetical protein
MPKERVAPLQLGTIPLGGQQWNHDDRDIAPAMFNPLQIPDRIGLVVAAC